MWSLGVMNVDSDKAVGEGVVIVMGTSFGAREHTHRVKSLLD